MKGYILFLLCFFLSCLPAESQTRQEIIAQYQKELGDYASLFTGKVEVPYDATSFNSLPYLHEDGSFRKGTVCFGGVPYEQVNLRIDLYMNQLVVETPQKHLKVVPQKEKTSFFTIDGQKFVNVRGTFVREEYAGRQCLLYSHLYRVQDVPDTQQSRKRVQFKSKMALWLVSDGQVEIVKDLSDLQSFFPSRKEDIRQYAKDMNLKFNAKNRIASIRAIVEFLER